MVSASSPNHTPHSQLYPTCHHTPHSQPYPTPNHTPHSQLYPTPNHTVIPSFTQLATIPLQLTIFDRNKVERFYSFLFNLNVRLPFFTTVYRNDGLCSGADDTSWI